MRTLATAQQPTRDTDGRALFYTSAVVLTTLGVFYTVVLTSSAPRELRATVSTTGLLIVGLLGLVSGWYRVRRTDGLRRRAC